MSGSGAMRHWLRLKTPVATDDGEGGQAITWTNGPVLAADLQPISAREQAVAGAIQTLATHRAYMHFDSRIVSTCRFAQVMPAGNDLQILGVRDLEGRQRWMEVDCEEVV